MKDNATDDATAHQRDVLVLETDREGITNTNAMALASVGEASHSEG